MDTLNLGILSSEISKRRLNVLRSPKKGGSSDFDSIPYLQELGIEIGEGRQPIQFTSNITEHIHRWAPYVQGFSASFVQSIFKKYESEYILPRVLDPFAGCGTVLVEAKFNGFESVGTELNPLLQFLADVKLNSWDVSPNYFLKTYYELSKEKRSFAPEYLKSRSHFKDSLLKNLEIIKGGIDAIEPKTDKQKKVKNLLLLAFSSILIDCSNMKRTPCLGYWKDKILYDKMPFAVFDKKIREIAADLTEIQSSYNHLINIPSKIILADAMKYNHEFKYDLIITSPPYMNGLDYVINYKIEMGWLGFVSSQNELKKIKDNMVVCDNVSKGLIKKFSKDKKFYTNQWLDTIKSDIIKNIRTRGGYRRQDMPNIVHKYFDDIYKVMRNVVSSMNFKGRFILVVGDSLIADVYIPTDLMIAKIGEELGLKIGSIEKARNRRSGQIRSYKLRESIITLKKDY